MSRILQGHIVVYKRKIFDVFIERQHMMHNIDTATV